jgi:excisionase family DNA binding protein
VARAKRSESGAVPCWLATPAGADPWYIIHVPEYYTTERAAEYLGVTPSRVRQLICEGRLRSEKYGRDHLIQDAVLVEYGKSGRKKKGRPTGKDLLMR